MAVPFSRQDFLCSTTNGVCLAWGGLRVLGSSSLSTNLVQGSPEILAGKKFIYGAAFFRPPNPPRAQRREMLKTIAQEYKFNIIRIYLA